MGETICNFGLATSTEGNNLYLNLMADNLILTTDIIMPKSSGMINKLMELE